MPKSKNGRNHKQRLAKYKANKKKEQELFKKKLMENYIKMQQESLAAKEAHTSTQEVSGPEINVDDLNEIEPWENNEQNITLEEESIVDIQHEPVYDDNDNK